MCHRINFQANPGNHNCPFRHFSLSGLLYIYLFSLPTENEVLLEISFPSPLNSLKPSTFHEITLAQLIIDWNETKGGICIETISIFIEHFRFIQSSMNILYCAFKIFKGLTIFLENYFENSCCEYEGFWLLWKREH